MDMIDSDIGSNMEPLYKEDAKVSREYADGD